MAASSSDKLLVGSALLLAVASAGVFGLFAWRHSESPSAPIARVELSSAPYEAKAPEAPPVKTETWSVPVAQSRGREWIYDAFTPPEIFYNTRSKQFTVKPPSSLMDEDAQEAFGLELVSVRPEPFRLQLIGYAGGEGNWQGMFENVLTGEVFLGVSGRRVPKLNVTIKNFEVSVQPIRMSESMVTRQRVATAVVRDEKSGRDVTLTHRERHFTGTVFAFVALPGETATREVRVGDMFKVGETTYRIEQIKIAPASVDVVKESPSLSAPDRRVLLPRETEEVERPEEGKRP